MKPSVKLLFKTLDELNSLRYSYDVDKQNEWVVDALTTIDEIVLSAIEEGYICPAYDKRNSFPTPPVQLDLFD